MLFIASIIGSGTYGVHNKSSHFVSTRRYSLYPTSTVECHWTIRASSKLTLTQLFYVQNISSRASCCFSWNLFTFQCFCLILSDFFQLCFRYFLYIEMYGTYLVRRSFRKKHCGDRSMEHTKNISVMSFSIFLKKMKITFLLIFIFIEAKKPSKFLPMGVYAKFDNSKVEYVKKEIIHKSDDGVLNIFFDGTKIEEHLIESSVPIAFRITKFSVGLPREICSSYARIDFGNCRAST